MSELTVKKRRTIISRHAAPEQKSPEAHPSICVEHNTSKGRYNSTMHCYIELSVYDWESHACSRACYLEGNEISSLPQCLFSSLSSLVWLDVRNNRLTGLPAAIGQHRWVNTPCKNESKCSHTSSDLEKCISASVSQQWMLCSEWVPSEWNR